MSKLTVAALEHLFANVATASSSGSKVSVNATYVEVYCEELRDLLSSDASTAATVRNAWDSPAPSPKPGMRESRVSAQRRAVDGVEAALALLEEGAARRTTAATQLNESSSRSHALFTLELRVEHSPRPAASGTDASCDLSGSGVEGGPAVLTPSITFVDLAGSERKRTGASGERLKGRLTRLIWGCSRSGMSSRLSRRVSLTCRTARHG